MVEPGEGWGHTPQILVDQLTLSQPVGVDYVHLITTLPSPFSIFRPSTIPAYYRAGKTRVGKEGNSPAYHILAEMEQNLRTYAAYEIESLVFFLDL